jgi:hypothetical protein
MAEKGNFTMKNGMTMAERLKLLQGAKKRLGPKPKEKKMNRTPLKSPAPMNRTRKYKTKDD